MGTMGTMGIVPPPVPQRGARGGLTRGRAGGSGRLVGRGSGLSTLPPAGRLWGRSRPLLLAGPAVADGRLPPGFGAVLPAPAPAPAPVAELVPVPAGVVRRLPVALEGGREPVLAGSAAASSRAGRPSTRPRLAAAAWRLPGLAAGRVWLARAAGLPLPLPWRLPVLPVAGRPLPLAPVPGLAAAVRPAGGGADRAPALRSTSADGLPFLPR